MFYGPHAGVVPMNHPRRFLIVEYDTDRANRWVPCPLSRTSLRVDCLPRITTLEISAGGDVLSVGRRRMIIYGPSMTKNGANEVADLQSGPFVSYAREDQPFVRKLHEALDRRQRDTWVDWEGIFPTEE